MPQQIINPHLVYQQGAYKSSDSMWDHFQLSYNASLRSMILNWVMKCNNIWTEGEECKSFPDAEDGMTKV